MKEVIQAMEKDCTKSIKVIIVAVLLLMLGQNAIVRLFPNSSIKYIILVPFVLAFLIIEMCHGRRLSRRVNLATKELHPVYRSMILSEWLFTLASYTLLTASMYISWFFLYNEMIKGYPITSNTFFFFSLDNMWLNALGGERAIGVATILVLIFVYSIMLLYMRVSLKMRDNRILAILLVIVTGIMTAAIFLFPNVYYLLVVLFALSIFALFEIFDNLNIEWRKQI